MNRRGAGICLVGISAALQLGRYISAAVFMSGTESQSAEIFRSGLRYVGGALSLLAIMSLMAGMAYLLAEEVMDLRVRKKDKEK